MGLDRIRRVLYYATLGDERSPPLGRGIFERQYIRTKKERLSTLSGDKSELLRCSMDSALYDAFKAQDSDVLFQRMLLWTGDVLRELAGAKFLQQVLFQAAHHILRRYTDRLTAMKYTIKQATADHVTLLAAIEIAAAGIFPPGSIPDHIRSDSTPVEMLLEAVQDGLLWAALTGEGTPVGYALVRLIEDTALLAQMDVHPDHMRRGIGSALIGQLVEQLRLRKKTALYLTTFTHVPWNAPFYAKQGFVAMNTVDAPPFLKNILEEEKSYGLSNRTAMCLEL